MNARAIWARWLINRQSTAQIARETRTRECDVSKVVALCRDAHFEKQPMPFEGMGK